MTLHRVFEFDNSYAAELEGLYVPCQGAKFPNPAVVRVNRELARELGVDADVLDTPDGAAFLAGSELPPQATPLAQAYAGHQFGRFSPQLGDGRALLIGEFIDTSGTRRDLHLKGSGATAFSRGGDGKAAVGPVLREFLIGEFMHAVGIPTTRCLGAVTTGETIMREEPLPGAVLARVAASHLRIGTFQYFAARGEGEKLRRLADYAIKRHDPQLVGVAEPYLGLLRAVADRQAALIAKWMAVGFVHGVMNTDNTTISGETIDYGPCAFIDGFDAQAVFSSIDRRGRYAYGNQPAMAQWNLARFSETLLGLMDPADPEGAIPAVTAVVEEFGLLYEQYWMAEMRAKLGLRRSEPSDRELVDQLHSVMNSDRIDFTQMFRGLAAALRGDEEPLRVLAPATSALRGWVEQWLTRQEAEHSSAEEAAAAMDRVNPLYIPRNHKVEEALEAATIGDYAPFEALQQLLAQPYTWTEGREDFAQSAPSHFGPYITYCGT